MDSAPRSLVLVDLEGILVDRAARTRAVVEAAGIYLESACCIRDGRRLALDHHAERLRDGAGLSDPWELTAALILYFLSALSPALRPPPARAQRLAQVRAAFKELNLRYGELLAHGERDMEPFIDSVRERGQGYAAVLAALKQDTIAGQILHASTLSPGPIDPGDHVGRLHQERFLGAELFKALHDQEPEHHAGPGLIDQEQPVAPPDELRELARSSQLALVAPRLDGELRHALGRLGLSEAIPVVVADLPVHRPARPGPPGADPWALERARALSDALHGVETPASRVFVLSERPSQMVAAAAAGFRPVGFTTTRSARRPLSEAGAQAVISRPTTLLRAIEAD